VDFLYFLFKIRVNLTGVVSSLVPPLLRPTSSYSRTVSHFLLIEPKWARYLCFISDNASSCCLPSRAKIEAVNLHCHRRPPSTDRPTPTLHFCKNVISTLVTLPTTQLHLYFASSLTRALCHRSSTRRCYSLLSSSHVHHPSTQWHSWWWTS
jgi:hypothetical protein